MSMFARTLSKLALLGMLASCGGSDNADGVTTPASNTGGNPPAPAPAPGPSPAPTPAPSPTPAPTPAPDPVPPPVSTVLPKIHIATAQGQPVTSTEDYIDAVVRVESENVAEQIELTTEIRGRGNTTWGMPKKPYRLKLSTATSMLGMPAERNWALLANYADKTMVRNRLAMTLGQQVGLAYTPRSRFVELYFNGAYQGVYEMFEHVEVSPNRIAIDQLDPDADSGADTISGGYFIEADFRLDEAVCWDSSLGVPFCAKDPEFDPADSQDPAHPSYAQFNYIRNYVDAVERSLGSPGDAYADLLDADAAVKWYLVQELMRNNDARMHSSVFLYKPRGGKLTFGPLWDFDIAAGNINYGGNERPTGWYIRNASPWHSRLFANTDFGRRVFEQWCQLRRDGVIDGLGAQIDRIVAGIDPAAIDRNFARWDILGTYVWPNNFVGQTYEEEVDYLKSWITTRAAWMHGQYVQTYGACPAS